MGFVPPLLILQTMQAVNWRLTDLAKDSHEDNVWDASASVILFLPRALGAMPLCGIHPYFTSSTPLSPPTWGFPFY